MRKGGKGVKTEEETKRLNGWLAALISKFSLSPLLVSHKGVTNDFSPSKALPYHLLTYPLHTSLTLKTKTKTLVGRLLQSLQLVLYHFEVLDCWHVYLEAAIKLLFLSL